MALLGADIGTKVRSEGEEGVDWAERRRNIWFKGPMVGVGKVSG